MCLLIAQPKGVTFSRADIQDFLWHNPDGFGAAWGDGQKLHIVKTLTDADAERVYRATVAGKHAMLHFRQATHGAVNMENTHPYILTPRIAVAHNGILSCGNELDPSRSDTWHMAEYFLKPIAEKTPELMFTDKFCAMLGGMIGRANKLIFIHADGRLAIVNRDAGTTYKKAWLSNTYAWSSPNERAWRTTGYGGAYRVSEGRAWSYRDTRAAAPTPSSVCTADAAHTWDDAETWGEIEAVYAEQGAHGVADWVRGHARLAEWLLVEYSNNVSALEAEDMVRNEPVMVAEFFASFCDALPDDATRAAAPLSSDPHDATSTPTLAQLELATSD